VVDVGEQGAGNDQPETDRVERTDMQDGRRGDPSGETDYDVRPSHHRVEVHWVERDRQGVASALRPSQNLAVPL